MPIQAVFFDVGGVLVRNADPSRRAHWERRLGLAEGSLEKTVWNSKVAGKAEVGQATVAEVWASIAGEFGLGEAEAKALEEDFWAGGSLDTELKAFLGGLRGRCYTALISSAWPDGREVCTAKFGLDTVTDAMFFTAEVGITKTNPALYVRALTYFGLEAGEALFVDDHRENLEAAQRVGIHGVFYRSREQVMADVNFLLGGV